jgi:hypothetical protein
VHLQFTGRVIEWRGPSPFFFVTMPEDVSDAIAAIAPEVTYGWGVIPVTAVIEDTEFTTSLFPKEGSYLLPLKVKVRAATGVDVDEDIDVTLLIGE